MTPPSWNRITLTIRKAYRNPISRIFKQVHKPFDKLPNNGSLIRRTLLQLQFSGFWHQTVEDHATSISGFEESCRRSYYSENVVRLYCIGDLQGMWSTRTTVREDGIQTCPGNDNQRCQDMKMTVYLWLMPWNWKQLRYTSSQSFVFMV